MDFEKNNQGWLVATRKYDGKPVTVTLKPLKTRYLGTLKWDGVVSPGTFECPRTVARSDVVAMFEQWTLQELIREYYRRNGEGK